MGAGLDLRLQPVAQVVQQQEYRDWMQRFGSSTKHLVVNSDAAGRPAVFASACRLQVCLLSVICAPLRIQRLLTACQDCGYLAV